MAYEVAARTTPKKDMFELKSDNFQTGKVECQPRDATMLQLQADNAWLLMKKGHLFDLPHVFKPQYQRSYDPKCHE